MREQRMSQGRVKERKGKIRKHGNPKKKQVIW
jgi:hypothetical protein